MNLLEARNLKARIGGRDICASLDFSLAPGEIWAVLGRNGIGKTTLLHTLGGLRAAASGSVRVDGIEITEWSRKRLAARLGVLFQDSNDAFPCSVVETALSGRYAHLPFWSFTDAQDLSRARLELAAVDLAGMEQRQVDTLSGGERRRLAIATLFLQAPRIWLLDEPNNHLDLRHQVGLLSLLVDRARRSGGGAVMTLHDVNLALRFCSHALLLVDAETVLTGTVGECLNEENLGRLYRCSIRRISDGRGGHFFHAA